ncbi:putative vacuolar effluxer which mediate the efflux of amino acids resulting from autophagic degradation [Lyophyllum shimeji]|uniref:Autophagy-related protein n=1 Tax=Lyophyllum shimeji TaxID=47721 RepID=A0A9P3PYU2_LYOSH|nr:putative vacuolar effluxer which mediate the efflux of amino acids resulting from autophagic degradation [Lyophyllum shimeji]
MLPASDTAAYKRKLHGWLSYAFASEVFVIVSLTLFLPICLEQFARDNGYLLPDRKERCSSVVKLSQRTEALVVPDVRCVVKIGWAWIDSASFSLYVYSISVALQALTVISMGGIADYPPHRKRLLLLFALLGASSATTFLVLPSTSPMWFLVAPLAVCANVGFGASVVAMNAYLPTLAKESPEVRQIQDEIENKHHTPSGPVLIGEIEPDADDDRTLVSSDATSPLIQRTRSEEEEVEELKAAYDAELSRVMSRISSFGIALGYGAGIVLLIIALIPVTMLHGSTFALRLAIGLSGIWWAAFSIPAALWLPGAEDPRTNGVEAGSDELGVREWDTKREIVLAWKRLGSMLRWTEMKKLRNTFKYLAAWFLLSDGFTTITSTAILFGKTTLNMQPSALILVGILTPTSGILGSLAWPYIQRRYGWTNLKVIVILVMMASAIPAYGCLGFLGIFQGDATRFGGLTTQGEMFALAVYFGSVYGAFQGYARAFYAELLPPGEEARWYGLFSITDKSSSFIGPLIVGLIADTTGNIRYAFFFLVVMIWMAMPILMSVDVDKGRKDARDYRYTAT